MRYVARPARLAMLFLLLVTGRATAQSGFVYAISARTFAQFDPGYLPLGINDLGQVVGVTHSGVSPFWRGFVKDQNGITVFDYPGAYDTELTGINNLGQIVGNRCSWSSGPYGIDCTGFLKDGHAFRPYTYPGALFTYGSGINNLGLIAGAYRVEIVVGPNTVQDFDHGLLVDSVALTAFDVPGATNTAAYGVNDRGDVVGVYSDVTSPWHGFLKQGNVLTSMDYPGAPYSFPTGINNSGWIVGSYQDRYGYRHGFLRHGGSYTSFDVPGSDTFPSGINSLGEVVGYSYPRPVVGTINSLITTVKQLGLPGGTTNSFIVKLNAAIAAFNTGSGATACTAVGAFMSEVNAQSGKKLTTAGADWLLAAGVQIEAILGCS